VPSTDVDVLTQFAPAFHGFYRAIISTPFNWSVSEWKAMSDPLNAVLEAAVVGRLNSLFLESQDEAENDPDLLQFIRVFHSRYVGNGRPLSGYFMICCVIEIQWTALAQALSTPSEPVGNTTEHGEAIAANTAWLSLTRRPTRSIDLTAIGVVAALQGTRSSALACFSDLLVQLEEIDSSSADTYAWETLSESLVRSFNGVGYESLIILSRN
jgi:phosphatidylinositol 4-kinase